MSVLRLGEPIPQTAAVRGWRWYQIQGGAMVHPFRQSASEPTRPVTSALLPPAACNASHEDHTAPDARCSCGHRFMWYRGSAERYALAMAARAPYPIHAAAIVEVQAWGRIENGIRGSDPPGTLRAQHLQITRCYPSPSADCQQLATRYPELDIVPDQWRAGAAQQDG